MRRMCIMGLLDRRPKGTEKHLCAKLSAYSGSTVSPGISTSFLLLLFFDQVAHHGTAIVLSKHGGEA